jgi:hypothetical protein
VEKAQNRQPAASLFPMLVATRFYFAEATIEITHQIPWRQIAWNGVRFSAPAHWEIGRIGLRYLELEVEAGPVMEVKWNRVKGRFSHKAHLQRLAGLQKRSLKKSFLQTALPGSWEKALEGYDACGFSWQSQSIRGKGVLIYDPASRLATLLQFYRREAAGVEREVPRLLSSFRDQLAGDTALWEVFDIRATIPAEFELQRFRFEAGRYNLIFATGHRQLQMVRLSPAAILLRRQDLAAVAGDSFQLRDKQSPQWRQRDAAAVEGELSPASAAARLAGRIRRQPVYRIFRLWHEIEKNRILGVQISGKQPVDRRQFAAICENYETV